MIVVDASALAYALLDDGPQGIVARGHIRADPALIAPEHLKVETFAVIRKRLIGNITSNRRAEDAVGALGELTVRTIGADRLLPGMWRLRDQITGYDAAYVVVAELYGCRLVTGDVRLAKSLEGSPLHVDVVSRRRSPLRAARSTAPSGMMIV